jgi:VWFA-related protein
LFIFALITGCILTSRTASAQAAPAGDKPMVLDVVVTDKADRPVSGLQATDFKVLENKQPRDVTGVRAVDGTAPSAEPPVQAILLVDEVNATFENMSRERKEIENYLRQSNGHLAVPTSLVFLDETDLHYQGKPTRDPKVLLDNLANNPNPQRLTQAEGGPQQYVQMREKSLQAMNGLALRLRDEPGRKLVIWISPGWQAFSTVNSQKSPKEFQALFDYIVGISTVLRDAHVTLYSADPYGGPRDLAYEGNTYYQQFVKGVASPKQADNGDLMLQVMATQTGGKVLYGSNSLSKMLDQCLADTQQFYVLSYGAQSARQANEYHAVEVRVNKPGLKVRTLTGFYAQP